MFDDHLIKHIPVLSITDRSNSKLFDCFTWSIGFDMDVAAVLFLVSN